MPSLTSSPRCTAWVPSRATAAEPDPSPRESAAWHDAYRSDEQLRRRRAAMPVKLRRLGLASAPPDAAVLDLCCGHGEALDALWAMGLRRLAGLDIAVDDRLASDGRFDVRQGDAKQTPWPAASFDWILNIHAMHHLGMAPEVARFLDECWRLLKPGGRLGIIDFPNSLAIRAAFWWFRQGWCQWTRYLRQFGRMIEEEWTFLKDYLPQFPEVERLLLEGRFAVERHRRGLFYFYLTLRKDV